MNGRRSRPARPTPTTAPAASRPPRATRTAAIAMGAILLLSLQAASGCARGRGPSSPPAVARTGGLTLEAVLDPDPPRQKGTALWVTLKDDRGEPVEGAEVTVGYHMPAMGAMAEMRGSVEAAARGRGRYRAELDLPMGGSFTIPVEVRALDTAISAEYRLTVGSRGLTVAGAATAVEPAPAPPPSPGQMARDRQDETAFFTCSMHPSVRRADPGTCPICSMDLVPVTREEIDSGVITIDPRRRQTIGVRTAAIRRQPLRVVVRAVGKVLVDETRLSDVTLKYRGWIGTLHVDAPGQPVREGQPLFTLYSPELYSAQEELLAALASQRTARATSAPDRADYLVSAARKRLRLWDVAETQVEEIVQRGEPIEYLAILSPVSGHVVEKNVVQGASVEPGKKLYRIASLDRIWIEAEVYESELPLVEVGQKAEVSLPYLPGRRFSGKVTFVYPYLDDSTRTGRVRIELPNRRLELKPDMYADVELMRDLGERLVVPEEAVLYAGPRRFVFLDLGGGRLRPLQIQTGVKAGDVFELLETPDGLKEGDVVVNSGNFLVAAESRLRAAIEHWQ